MNAPPAKWNGHEHQATKHVAKHVKDDNSRPDDASTRADESFTNHHYVTKFVGRSDEGSRDVAEDVLTRKSSFQRELERDIQQAKAHHSRRSSVEMAMEMVEMNAKVLVADAGENNFYSAKDLYSANSHYPANAYQRRFS